MSEEVRALVLKVDATTELARRQLVSLSSLLDSEAGKMEGSLKRVDAAHVRTGQSANSARMSLMEMQHVFRSYGDSVAAGQDPLRAFILELGRVGQAAEAMGQNGGLGAIGKFLGGPWGLVISAAIAGVASFAMQTSEATKTVQSETEELRKNQKETDLAAKAKEAFEHTADGAAAAIHKETQELEKQNRTIEDNVRLELRQLEAKRAAMVLRRGQLPMEEAVAQTDLRRAHASVAAAERGDYGPDNSGAVLAAYQAQRDAADKIRGIHAEAKSLDVSIGEADRAIRMALTPLASEAVKRSNDPSVAVTNKTDDAIKKLHQSYEAGTITFEKMVAEEDRLTAARDRELKKIQEANRHHSDRSAETEATSIAYVENWLKRTLPGVQVTSTTGGHHVANSDHYAGRAIDFVPPGGLGSMTKADVEHMFESAGLRIRRNAAGVEQLFGPWMGTGTALGRQHQNHIHVGFEGTAPTGAQLDKAAESAREKAARNQEAYEQLLLRAQEDLANATRGRATTAEEAEAIAVEDIEIERSRKQSAAQAMVAEGRMTQAQADQLSEKYRQIASAKIRTAAEVATQRVIEREAEHERTMLTGMVTLLQLQEGFAVTAAERKRIALQILDYEERQAKASLRAALAAEKDPDRRHDIQTRLGQIDQQHGLKVAQIDRANETPMQRYRRELNEGLADVNGRIEDIEVQGIKQLDDDLASAAAKALHLSGALGQVAQALIRIGLEKGLQALFSLFGGGGFGSNLSSAGFQDTMNGFGVNGFSGQGFASGGDPPVGMASLVGERGPELFVPKSAGTILPNSVIRRALAGSAAAAGGSRDDVVVHIDLNDEMFTARVERVSGRQLAVAAPVIATGAAKAALRQLTRPRL